MSPVMTSLASAPAESAAGHTYVLPVVRELPRPNGSGSGAW
jgi:hypothetical protein